LVYLAERKHHRLGEEIVPMKQPREHEKDDSEDIPVI
jgi:hypothetical protein